MSIFISVASYRDPELVRTIKSAIDNAAHPEDLYFSVVLQEFDKYIPDLSWVPKLDLIQMHPRDARGAGFARAKAITNYKKQDYFLQIDSHTLFEKNWDIKCIDQLKRAQEISKNEKIILSYFPPPFYVQSNKEITIVKNSKIQLPYPTRQKPKLTKRNEWTAERVEFIDTKRSVPEPSTTVLAGFIFSLGKIIEEVPYDPEISFFGEEICFALRAWTRGWDIYSPSVVLAYHFYTREGYSKIWKDRNIRKVSWKELEQISKEKQRLVLCGIEQGTYGAGTIRTIDMYEQMTGINFKKMYNNSSDTIVVGQRN